jgi:hypothetical protein
MASNDAREIILEDSQIEDGCHKHVLCVSAVDEDTVMLVLDNEEPIQLSRATPIQAKTIYGALRFARGAKYGLIGYDSFSPMEESVYKDFFALIRDIVIGINELDPGSLVLPNEDQEES